MSDSSTTVLRGAARQPKHTLLRRLRLICILAVIGCAILLPIELGIITLPAATALKVPARVVPTAVPSRPTRPSVVFVQNEPRTVIIGHTERFSVHIPGLSRAKLHYVLTYPNGHRTSVVLKTDAHGFSSHDFHLNDYRLRHFREEGAVLQVKNMAGKVLATLRFAIQQKQ